MEHRVSGVGVLDKSIRIIDAVAEATVSGRSCSLPDLVSRTYIPKPTLHRLASALETHGLLRRGPNGNYELGGTLGRLGRLVDENARLAVLARPMLVELQQLTGESVQMYIKDGDHRVCLVSLEGSHELRTIVAQGARLALGVGSAGRLLAGETTPQKWCVSLEERAPGVASLSAPVYLDGALLAAIGISGPLGRVGENLGERLGEPVLAAAAAIEQVLGEN